MRFDLHHLKLSIGATVATGILVAVIILIFVGFGIFNKRGITMIRAESAKKLIEEGSFKIIDVRTSEEFKGGHLKGALLFPVSDINKRIGELESMKDSELLVYCHSGGRSSTACQILRGQGFSKVYNLQGGVRAWTGSGYALVR